MQLTPSTLRLLGGAVANHRLERTAQQRRSARCWVPSSLRSSAAAQASRWANLSDWRPTYAAPHLTGSRHCFL